MKKKFLFYALLALMTSPIMAQQKAAKPVKVAKEIAKIMKTLPQEAQMRLLEQAKREASIVKAVDKRNEVAMQTLKTAQLAPQTPAQPINAAASARPNLPSVTVEPALVAPPQSISPSTTKISATPGENRTFTSPTPPPPTKEEFIVKAESMPKTTISWNEELYDFGKIKQGDVVSHTFTFKNTGENPLQITNIKPSCGCTTPNWSKDPVAPGAEGTVELKFNSAHKSGTQIKSVTLYMNTEPMVRTLTFKGEVIVGEGQPAGGQH